MIMIGFQSIVHNNLVSPCVSERIDGARHLGALNCCDAMVMYALKERLKHDEEIRVKYEATKSLVSLGRRFMFFNPLTCVV